MIKVLLAIGVTLITVVGGTYAYADMDEYHAKKQAKLPRGIREAMERRKQANEDNTDDLGKLKERANGGHAAAQVKLGAYYADSKDYKQAIVWYKKAAKNGNSSGMYNLAALYDRGVGVKQDNKAAFKYYKNAADKGDLYAITRLGEIYYQGLGGTPVDKEVAIRYWQRASDANFIPAMSRMCKYAPRYMIDGPLRMYCSGE